jgi:hypothetical protein
MAVVRVGLVTDIFPDYGEQDGDHSSTRTVGDFLEIWPEPACRSRIAIGAARTAIRIPTWMLV